MLYREAGQYKVSYQADQSVFPILQDRIGSPSFWPSRSWSCR